MAGGGKRAGSRNKASPVTRTDTSRPATITEDQNTDPEKPAIREEPQSGRRGSPDVSSPGSLTTLRRPLSKRRSSRVFATLDTEKAAVSEDDLSALRAFAKQQGLFWFEGWPVQIVPDNLVAAEDTTDKTADMLAVMEFGSCRVFLVRRDEIFAWDDSCERRGGLREFNGGVTVGAVIKDLSEADNTGKWPKGWWQERVPSTPAPAKNIPPSVAHTSAAPVILETSSTPTRRQASALANSRRSGAQLPAAPLAVARGPAATRLQLTRTFSKKRTPAETLQDSDEKKVRHCNPTVNETLPLRNTASDRSKKRPPNKTVEDSDEKKVRRLNPTTDETLSPRKTVSGPVQSVRRPTRSQGTKPETTVKDKNSFPVCNFIAPEPEDLVPDSVPLNKYERRVYHIGRDILLGGDGCLRCDDDIVHEESIWSLIASQESKTREGAGATPWIKPAPITPVIPPGPEQVTKADRAIAIQMLEHEGAGRRALRNNVLWVKVTGNPFWLAQRIPPDVAEQLTGGIGKKGAQDEFCVYYFGTREHAYVTPSTATASLDEGLKKKWHLKYPDRKRYTYGLLEAGIYLSKPRRYPWRWWDSFNAEDPPMTDVDAVDAQSPCPGLFSSLLEFTGLVDFEDAEALPTPRYQGSSRHRAIKKNVYPANLKPTLVSRGRSAASCCSCDKSRGENCSDNCLNRASYFLCNARDCPVGSACTNTAFERREGPVVEKFETGERGYGIRACQMIKQGSFIVEYVGEIIPTEDCAKRMDSSLADKEENFYFMDLGDGLTIDARDAGNFSRFINSSCDPNCVTQKWRDTATCETRVAIIAAQDIAPLEEITYNYNLTRKATAARFVCRCGAKNCSGKLDEKRKTTSSLLGFRVEVYFPMPDAEYYPGTITDVVEEENVEKHVVSYDDGEVEMVDLNTVTWRRKDVPSVAV